MSCKTPPGRIDSAQPIRLLVLMMTLLAVMIGMMAHQLSHDVKLPMRLGLTSNGDLDALLAAVLTNDVCGVRRALSRPIDVNAIDYNGRTALCHVASDKHPQSAEIARILIEHGADVHYRDELGFTLLQRAVCFNNDAVAAVLLRAGADPNVHSRGTPALHLATQIDASTELVQTLLDYGADPRCVYEGKTAAQAARLADNEPVARLIEQHARQAPQVRR